MIKYRVLGFAMVLLASAGIASNASAQEKTSAQFRQEPIQAGNNGLTFVTDGLTRKQVYGQLVQAEQDGSLARLNATLYKGR